MGDSSNVFMNRLAWNQQHTRRRIPAPTHRQSIVSRLGWSYFISSTLPLMLAGMPLVGLAFQAQRDNAHNSQRALADQIAGNISTFIYGIEQQTLRFGTAHPFDAPTSTLDRMISTIVVGNPDLRSLSIVEYVLQAVVAFAGDAEQHDDVIIAVCPSCITSSKHSARADCTSDRVNHLVDLSLDLSVEERRPHVAL